MALPALISLIGTLAGELRASALSFHMFMLFIGASLAPIISIYLIDTVGHRFTFVMLAGLLLLSTVVPFYIRLEKKENTISQINQENTISSPINQQKKTNVQNL
jgi:MFS family permease